MPLPTTKPVQSSIRSFFTSSTPQYAPPPGQSPPPPPAPPPPPPPSTLKQQTQQGEKQQQQEKEHQEKLQQEEQKKQEEQQEQGEHQKQHEHEKDQQQEQQEHQQSNISLPSPPSKSTIPPSATIRIPTEADLPPFRRINALLLQVAYTESYYASTLHDPLSRVITWSHDGQAPKVVGAVVCLIEDADTNTNTNTNAHDPLGDEAQSQRPKTLYIRSMCLLAPYRGLGLAQAALEDILEGVLHRNVNVVSITAHVWTENEDGLRWYKGRGFEKDSVKPLEGYYLRLRPGTAWLVRKTLPDRHGAAQKGGFLGQRNGNGKGEGEGEERGVVIPESVTAAVVNMPPSPPPPAAAAAAAAAATTTTPASGPASTPTPETRPTPISGQSFQNQRPETEWNDLPEDMAPPRASALRGKAAGEAASGAGAGAGSRSASAGGKKKRDRSYPAAAFGS
ncbi:hypothetical protein E4U60_002414 [Claviceps pazoutovae]|uniref:N-acetyltransferase domain-containing protein n=1 Tax=Claviceps pazoutovae TaxID=1649127 RepID=A0A9P7MB32_9HYPO|nr:hypothetical protein E4U60_002414 [Claviceps pazoutovae]